MKKVIIIGGGIAGLITSIKLARSGISCLVIEKKAYPIHRVCGEYISNEVVPFLSSLNLYPAEFKPSLLNQFILSTVGGKVASIPLPMGGFGISRFTFDNFLYEEARKSGVEFFLNTEVNNVQFKENQFIVEVTSDRYEADVVIGCFGKRSKLDQKLERSFIKKRSPFIGVKYHIRSNHPANLIALHNFEGGYCGINNVEDNKTNLCYLSHRDNLKKYKSIKDMEENVLYRNPLLKSIFLNAQFLLDKPETINEISFETKQPITNHILMAGDAAGMITPLCGNGMAMAIHASKIVSDLTVRFITDPRYKRAQLEFDYEKAWRKEFSRRLWAGRQIQKLFGSAAASNLALNLAIHVKPITNFIVSNTYGRTF